MLALLGLLLIVWLAAGVIGFTVHGLTWLGIVGVALLLVTLAFGGARRIRR